jgi:hypothetical protein
MSADVYAGPERSGLLSTTAAASEDEDRPTYRVSAFTVYPSGFDRVSTPDKNRWRIQVVDAGDGWVVRWRTRCLNYQGVWEYEPAPKGRTPEFLRRCRFSEQAALLRAKKAVDGLVVDGMTFDEFVDHVMAESAARAAAVLEQAAAEHPTLPRQLRLLQAFRQSVRLV